MKTTLITGGLGFIGSSICDALLQKKYTKRCILVDNFGGYMNPIKDNFTDFRKQRFPSLKNIIIERCDTSNYKAFSLILNKYKPNYIYHTAALPLAKVSNLNNEEAKISSVDSTVNIVDAIPIDLNFLLPSTSTYANYQLDIEDFLNKESKMHKVEPWNKLDKTTKVKKLEKYADKLKEDNKLTKEELATLYFSIRNLFCSSCIICTVEHILVAFVNIFMYLREYLPDILGLSSLHSILVS